MKSKCDLCRGNRSISTAEHNLPCPKCQKINMRAFRVRDLGRAVISDAGEALFFADTDLLRLAAEVRR